VIAALSAAAALLSWSAEFVWPVVPGVDADIAAIAAAAVASDVASDVRRGGVGPPGGVA
jgi:hypothetical protein